MHCLLEAGHSVRGKYLLTLSITHAVNKTPWIQYIESFIFEIQQRSAVVFQSIISICNCSLDFLFIDIEYGNIFSNFMFIEVIM